MMHHHACYRQVRLWGGASWSARQPMRGRRLCSQSQCAAEGDVPNPGTVRCDLANHSTSPLVMHLDVEHDAIPTQQVTTCILPRTIPCSFRRQRQQHVHSCVTSVQAPRRPQAHLATPFGHFCIEPLGSMPLRSTTNRSMLTLRGVGGRQRMDAAAAAGLRSHHVHRHAHDGSRVSDRETGDPTRDPDDVRPLGTRLAKFPRAQLAQMRCLLNRCSEPTPT